MTVAVEILKQAGLNGGSAPKHHWTDDEREIVRRDYDGTNKGSQRIAEHLGVTLFAVKGQAAKMGILKDKSPAWTKDEVEKLTELITQYAPGTVAKKLHRSINAVVIKAKRLHLSRRIRDGWFTKRDVSEILGVDHKWVQTRIDNGSLKAHWHTDIKPCKEGGAKWHINEEDLRDFIINHCFELTGRNVDLFLIVQLLVDLKESR